MWKRKWRHMQRRVWFWTTNLSMICFTFRAQSCSHNIFIKSELCVLIPLASSILFLEFHPKETLKHRNDRITMIGFRTYLLSKTHKGLYINSSTCYVQSESFHVYQICVFFTCQPWTQQDTFYIRFKKNARQNNLLRSRHRRKSK